jgi:hypothetical protein
MFNVTLNPNDLRGWIMQGKVFTRRNMVFSSEEVQWECPKARVYECSGITSWDSHNDQQLHRRAKQETRKAFHWPVRLRHGGLAPSYTLRSLTKETDKVVPFSGMATKFSSYDNSTYYAGIWQS